MYFKHPVMIDTPEFVKRPSTKHFLKRRHDKEDHLEQILTHNSDKIMHRRFKKTYNTISKQIVEVGFASDQSIKLQCTRELSWYLTSTWLAPMTRLPQVNASQ